MKTKSTDKLPTITVGLQGYVSMSVTEADGNVRKLGPWPNLITNLAVNAMLNGPSGYNALIIYCGVGTGSTTPNVTDTQLTTQVGIRSGSYTQVSLTNSGAPNYNVSLVQSYTFAIGAVSGNLTEVGFFSGSTGANCASHSLIKDSGGNPVAFPVLVTEQLTVTYEIRTVPVLTDTGGSITINSTTYTTNLRTAIIGASVSFLTNAGCLPNAQPGYAYVYETNTLGAVTSSPAGTPASSSSAVLDTYTANSFFRDTTITWLPAIGNFTLGVGSVSFLGTVSAGQGFQMSFTPRIPKISTQTLTLKVRLALSRP